MGLYWDEITVDIDNATPDGFTFYSTNAPDPGEYGTPPVITLASGVVTTAFVGRSSSASEIGFAVSSVSYQFTDGVLLILSSHMPFPVGQHTTVTAVLDGASAGNYTLSGTFPGHEWHGQGRRDTATITVKPAPDGTGTTSLTLSNTN